MVIIISMLLAFYDNRSPPEGVPACTNNIKTVPAVIVLAVVVSTLGIFTCVVSHYKMGARRQDPGGEPPRHHGVGPLPSAALPGALDAAQVARATAIAREKSLRHQSVNTDFALDLPVAIKLPDGEEYPISNSTYWKIRDAEQQSEIASECIRPPPNRTVHDRPCSIPPPHPRSGLLSSACEDNFLASPRGCITSTHSRSKTNKSQRESKSRTSSALRTHALFKSSKNSSSNSSNNSSCRSKVDNGNACEGRDTNSNSRRLQQQPKQPTLALDAFGGSECCGGSLSQLPLVQCMGSVASSPSPSPPPHPQGGSRELHQHLHHPPSGKKV